MKTIKLTEEHEYMLLEMCKKIFPEDYRWFLEEGTFIEGHIIGNDPRVYEGEIPEINIHWLEFCLTHLSHKIIFNPQKTPSSCNNIHSDLVKNLMKVFYEEKNGVHPVDYLYQQFKELNL